MASARSAGDQVWAGTIWKLESGFFARDREWAVVMQIHQFSIWVIPDIDEAIQFFRVCVEAPDLTDISGEIWVIFLGAPGYAAARAQAAELYGHHPRLGDLRARLFAALPEATFCFVTDDREGFARLVDSEAAPAAFAAATAVVKYCASWDESNPIVIATDRGELAVSVDFTEGHYLATVRFT